MTAETTRNFLWIANQQGLLATETLHTLTAEAARQQVDPVTLVLQKGLLSPVQVEIVETLRQPTAAIPGYEILSVIGQGGMGVVYKARQLNLDRVVALKTILVNQAANPTMLARFEQEAQTVARLVHPHIVAAYDFGRHAGRLYFAMEYVEGEDAEHFARREYPLRERVVWSLVRQAAAGLAHAAELGVVHRDIKPANLLLVTPPKGYPLPAGMPMVKIADFGLALLANEADERTKLTAEQTTVGSPHYMAPEQLAAGKPVDLRADIYSLGATAYHLLAGHPPFDGRSLPQIIAAKLSDERLPLPAARDDVSAEGVALLQAMMMRDPTQRIGSYTELLSRLDLLPALRSSGSASTIAITRPASGETATISPPHDKTSVLRTTGKFVLDSLFQEGLTWVRQIVAASIAAVVLAAVVYLMGTDDLLKRLGMSRVTLFPTTPSAPTTHGASLPASGWVVELFDGRSLRGWFPQHGFWTVSTDDEGGAIFVGTDGEILHPLLFKRDGGKTSPLSNYRMLVTTRLHQATAVELHFDVNLSGQRHVLRLTPTQVALGRSAAAKAPFEPLGSEQPRPIGTDRLHELKLERQATEWRAFVDETLVGTIPLAPERELPEFRLVAQGGPAWFADTVVEELSPENRQPTPAKSDGHPNSK